jgi:hypothetical protein
MSSASVVSTRTLGTVRLSERQTTYRVWAETAVGAFSYRRRRPSRSAHQERRYVSNLLAQMIDCAGG